MAAFFGNLRNVVIAGFVLAHPAGRRLLRSAAGLRRPDLLNCSSLRWLHIVCGVMWIGLLWYFNFVSTPTMPKIPAELKPALGRYHHAGGAVLVPLGRDGHDLLRHHPGAAQSNYLVQAYTLDLSDGAAGWPVVPKYLAIGIGMWLGTIMWFNVWFVIWPNQQKALNIGGKYPDLAGAGEGRRRQDRGHVQPHQHAALDPDAVQHGGGGASVLIGEHSRHEGAARAIGRLFRWMPMNDPLASLRAVGARRRSGPLFLGPVRAGGAAAASVRALCLQPRGGAGGRDGARADAGRDPAGMVARDAGRRARRHAAQP